MNYTRVLGEKSTVKFSLTFSETEYQEAMSDAFTRTRGRYQVPGFRRGKAPRNMIENFYGKGVFFDEALRILYSKHYSEILEKENISPVATPSIDVPTEPNGDGFVLDIIVAVKPEVEIEAYKGLKFKKYEYNVTEEDVEKEVKRIFQSRASDTPVTDRPCQLGDATNIDFKGSVDGVEFPGGTAEDFNLVLGSHSFIPGFEEGVVGMSIGETKNINVKFPDDYNAEELRGKDAVFEIKLNSVTEKIFPEITDELVQEAFKSGGAYTVNSVEELKNKVRTLLKNKAERDARAETEDAMIQEICKHAKAEIPDALIEEEIDDEVAEFEEKLKPQRVTLGDYLSYMKLSMAQFRAQFKEQSEKKILARLVISKIIHDENLKVEKSDMDAALEAEAKEVEKTVEEYKKNVKEEVLNSIANNILVTKFFNFLEANNTFEE